MGLIGAPTYPMLRDVTRLAFLELMEANGIPHEFRASENAIYLPEPKAEIIFRSLDKPERLVGTNLAWFGVDELTYCKEDAWRRLEARLRHPKAKRLCGFGVWTPKGFEWVWARFIGPKRVEGYDAIFAKPGENRHLPPDFYERLKRSYDQRFYKQEVLGEYLNIFSGQAYYSFDRKENVSAVEFNPRLPICWAMDFNVNPMASVISQIDGEYVRVLEEIVLPNSNTRQSCETFKERAAKYLEELRAYEYLRHVRLQVKVYGDPAGQQRKSSADQSDWQIVREFFARNSDDFEEERHVGTAAPSIRSRVAAFNGRLLSESGDRRITIHPRCEALITDLEQVAWKVDSHGNTVPELDKSNPKLTHVSDALGYEIEREFGYRIVGGERKEYLGV